MDEQYLYDSEYLEWCAEREQEFRFQIDEEFLDVEEIDGSSLQNYQCED